MNDGVLDRVLQCPSLPSLPAIAAEVVELTGDTDVCMNKLARAVVKDQALAARVLRTVNSSFYGLRQQCTSIRKALVLLGLGPVKGIVLSFSLIAAVEEEDQNQGLDMEAHWRRALFTATAAKLLLLRAGEQDASDEAFLGGLLQDIGVIAMHRTLGPEYRAVLRDAEGDHRDLSRIEMDRFGVAHPEVGAMLGARWRLPETLTLPVRHHERPTASPGTCAATVRSVMLGNLIHDLLTDDEPAPILRLVYRRAADWFRLASSEVDALLPEITEAVVELEGLFNLDTGARPSPEAILEAAGRQLEQEIERSEAARAFAENLDSMLVGEEDADPVTGLFGREALDRVLRSAFYLAGSRGETLSLTIMAVDQFTEVCGRGPEGLDGQITRGIADLLNRHFARMGGVNARLMPGLFAVVIVGASRQDVIEAAEGFREAVGSESPRWQIPGDDGSPSLTASIGVVSAEGGATLFASPEQMKAMGLRAAQGARAAGGNTLRSFVPGRAA